MATLRPLALPSDQVSLERLDLSFISHAMYLVERLPNGFALVERPSSPPLENRYQIDWAELTSAAFAIVAEHAGHLVGIGALTITEWNRRATLAHLYVDRASRGKGVGTQLLEALASEAQRRNLRALWVETQNVNVSAIAFYRAHGFKLCGLDTSLYDPDLAPGETAIYFVRALEDSRHQTLTAGAPAV
ncbi:MAG: GNAT family N-acetyltransferase [Cytophagaceae bacterium]|nr:GNAT family N-acetyltransferase [Gemmatimonadaceae bacterium]